MVKHCLGNSEMNSIPQLTVFFHNFSRTKAKAYAFNLTVRADHIHSQREIVFDPEKSSPFPLAQGIQLRARALRLIPCLIPYHRCENLQENHAKLTISIRQRDNIHAKATDICVRMAQFVLKIEKLSHIIGARGFLRLTVSIPDYGS